MGKLAHLHPDKYRDIFVHFSANFSFSKNKHGYAAYSGYYGRFDGARRF